MSVWVKQNWVRCPPRWICAARLTMNIAQLLIMVVAIIGVIVIVLLAIIPSLLDYPRGRDKDEFNPPAPSPLKPDDHRDDSMNLAA
jgi:heme/copper-type cytochrome/quinol oxidase subunit 2